MKTSDFRLKRYTTVREQLSIPSKEPLREKNFGWDPPFQRFLSRFWVVCSNFCQNVFRAVVKSASYVSRRKLWLVFFCRICCFFSKFEHTFIEVLNVKFHHCPQNNIQHVQRNNWRKKISLLFSKFFLISEWLLLAVLAKVLSQGCRNWI